MKTKIHVKTYVNHTLILKLKEKTSDMVDGDSSAKEKFITINVYSKKREWSPINNLTLQFKELEMK